MYKTSSQPSSWLGPVDCILLVFCFSIVLAVAITVEFVGKILIRGPGITAYQHFTALKKQKQKQRSQSCL
jgi:hypothetical protein